jgi:hypothetical protein
MELVGGVHVSLGTVNVSLTLCAPQNSFIEISVVDFQSFLHVLFFLFLPAQSLLRRNSNVFPIIIPMLETLDMEVPIDQDGSQVAATVLDDNDMQRMGKIQELKVCVLSPWLRCLNRSIHILEQRNLRPLTALSFASVLQATWEFMLM